MLNNTSLNGILQYGDITPMKSDMPEDDARSEATFDFVVKNLSRIKDAVLSEPCMILNLPWKIMAMQRPDNTANRSSSRSLGFFLQCNGEEESESSSWSCLANAQLSILSQKEGVEDFSRKIQHLFYSEENDWGFSHFMSWNDVMNPKHGYIKDDTIILRAVITADAPQGVSWDSKKHTRYVGLKNRVEATFDFVIENFSRIKDAVLSEPCMICNLPWKIMAMKRPGNTADQSPPKSLGFFLQCNGEREGDSESSSWSCFANAQLIILSQKEGVEDFSRKIQHLFYSKENDWGFCHFMSWNDVMNPERGYIKDDTIILRAVITADAPQGVSWDSKKHTRYVGLKNQVEATFDFVVENFSRITDTVLSEPCMIRNLPWRIMAMQKPGNTSNPSSSKSLGFFLQCNGEEESESSSWSCFANAQLIILSQKEGVEDFSRKIQHLFYSEENDWGFSHFMSWNDVMNPERGYIKDDTIILRAVITADAPHTPQGVSGDSKKHTRYVGLKNQVEVTFDFVVENLSHIKDPVLSEPCMICNLPWKIMAMQRPGNTADRSPSKSLGFFLQCNGEREGDSESSSWSCFANAQLIILSQKEGVEDFSRKIQHLFYSKENDWGFSHFMSWNDVMNPERGYIKDDTIILRAVVTVDAPHSVSWDKKHTG